MKSITAAIILLVWVQAAWAGSISLKATTVCYWGESGLVADLTVQNEGGEPAEAVAAEVLCRGASWKSPGGIRLAPDSETTFRAVLKPALGLPGTYAALVRIRYRDGGGRAYTALSHGLFEYKSPGKSFAVAWGESQEIRADRPFLLVVTNADMVPHRFRVQLIVPDEIGPTEPTRVVELEPGGKTVLEYGPDGMAFPTGAHYFAQAFIEYEHDGLHHGDAMDIPMIVREIPPFFVRYRVWLIGLAGLILLCAVYVEWAMARKRIDS